MIKEMKTGFKKAYYQLNNSEKIEILEKILQFENLQYNEDNLVEYLRENKIYKSAVLETIVSWNTEDILKTFQNKRNKELESIKKDYNNQENLNKLLDTLNENTFKSFFQSFS